MGELLYAAVIPLQPRTKKNSQEIRYKHIASPRALYRRDNNMWRLVGTPFIAQGSKYEEYERDAGWFLKSPKGGTISRRVNVRCYFYRKDNQRVDLTNLLEAIDDILVKYKVIEDDNFKILAGHDGSRVLIDKDHPRTEIYIEGID